MGLKGPYFLGGLHPYAAVDQACLDYLVQESFQEFEIAYFVASLVSRDFDHLEFEAILWTVAEFAYCWG